MSPDPRTLRGPAGVVVGVGDEGLDTYRSAVHVAAREAALRHVSLRIVHGSKPAGQESPATASGMASRQQRGRRLVNGAARDLAATPLGQTIRIWTESSPQTGASLLLAHSRTAAMLVLQRLDGPLSAGRTTSAVITAARCPTLVTRPGDRTDGDLGVLVLLDPEHDPAPAIALAFVEARLRGTGVTLLDGRNDPEVARPAIRLARAHHPDVSVSRIRVGTARPPHRLRELSVQGALIVVVRPGGCSESGMAAAAADDAACAVMVVAPIAAQVHPDMGRPPPAGGEARR